MVLTSAYATGPRGTPPTDRAPFQEIQVASAFFPFFFCPRARCVMSGTDMARGGFPGLFR
eukprot:467885-Rhodomonas_salina.3